MFQHKVSLMVALLLFQVVLLSGAAVHAQPDVEDQQIPSVTIPLQEAETTPEEAATTPLTADESEDELAPLLAADSGDDHPIKYTPMPLPEWSPPFNSDYSENSMVAYDIAAGEQSTLGRLDSMEPATSAANVADGNPLLSEIEAGEFTPRDFTGLERVSQPADHPWSVNVRLEIDWPSGRGGGCSGVLVDPRWILTAGHCVFSHTDGGWATAIRVVPAYDDGDEPFGDAFASHFFSWSGWTENGSFDWDIAHVVLNRPIGALTGWHGFGYNDGDSFFEDNTFHNPGYPGESPYDFEHMYYWYGDYDDADSHIVRHNDRSYRGQSGSGSYYREGNGRWVYAVLSHGTDTWTGQTRITSSKFDYILDTIRDGIPARPDLVPLDVNASPGTITAGDRLSALNVLLHNYASVTWEGTVNIRVYLSNNDNVSTDDQLLATAQYGNAIGAKHSVRLNFTNPPLIPISKEGRQWVGVIIDIADDDMGNNDTDGWDAAAINIQPFVPAAPADVQASNATSPDKVVLTWSAVANAVSYQVYRATSSSGTKTFVGETTSLRFEDKNGVPGTLYYYFVRAEAANGQAGEFSQPIAGRRAFFNALPIVS